jgi:hypothetical protein
MSEQPRYVAGIYADRAKEKAVLVPCWGQLRHNGDRERAVGAIAHKLHIRLGEISHYTRRHNLAIAAADLKRLSRMRDCRKAFGPTAKDQGWGCFFETFCPWCWARAVVARWWAVDWAFFAYDVPGPVARARETFATQPSLKNLAATPRSPACVVPMHKRALATLVERRVSWIVEKALKKPYFNSTNGLEVFLKSRTCHPRSHREPHATARVHDLRLLEEAGLLGALEHLRIEPSDGGVRWRVTAAQILMMPAAFEPAQHPSFQPDCLQGASVDYHRTRRPSRAAVARAVASAFAYPTFLLAGSLEPVIDYLCVRSTSRCTVTRGTFRNETARKRCLLVSRAD